MSSVAVTERGRYRFSQQARKSYYSTPISGLEIFPGGGWIYGEVGQIPKELLTTLSQFPQRPTLWGTLTAGQPRLVRLPGKLPQL